MRKHLPNVLWVLLTVLSVLQQRGQIQISPILSCILLAWVVLIVIWTYLKFDSPPQYREHLYQPFDPYDLPPETRDSLDLHTADFRDLGFEKVEDTRLQQEPYRHDLRLFLNAREDIWGEVNLIDNQCISLECTSIFADGMKIDTSSISSLLDTLPEAQDRMQWNLVPGANVEEIYQRHMEVLQRYQTETGAELMVLAPEDFQDVVTYGHRLHWHWRRRQGLTDQPVPEAALPQPRRVAVLS